MRWLVIAAFSITACATAKSQDDEVDAAPRGDPPLDAAPTADAAEPDAAPVACDQGDINVVDPGSGHCYMVFADSSIWNASSLACSNLDNGAHLVTIFDATENNVVRNLTTGTFWIGANDAASEGNFVWVTGETVNSTFENWDGEEPNNSGGENCAEMRTDNTWNDTECGDEQRFVCERP